MAKARRIRLNARLTDVATPLFLVGPDREILFFNRGCEQLTGWSADEILGRRCDYASSSDALEPESIIGTLCPPPETFAGTIVSVPVFLKPKTGGSIPRMLQFFPLLGEAADVDCILGVITAIDPPQALPTRPSHQLHAELASIRATLRSRYGQDSIIAKSPAMHRVMRQIFAARENSAPILLTGENGTGKEHIARLIHYSGPLSRNAFVPLDCRRIEPIDLKLTFRRLSREQDPEAQSSPQPMRHPGTIFLNSLQDIPRDIQEVIVESESEGQLSEVRLITSTTENIETLRATEVLRDDFYFLISAFHIEVPPLRQRTAELTTIAQAFLEERNRSAAKQLGGFSAEVLERFESYNWPGNMREMALVVAEAAEAATGPLVEETDLPFRFRTGYDAQTVGPPIAPQPSPLEPYLEKVEREQIELALEYAKFNKKKAADLLGITRPKLYRRMEILGIADGDGT
ncbi:sigma 54-interacting transcriptional regulator [Thalassoroseus pseudoceratinae]|uniref:sigma 54-interacting transcriptional regulator n=1 Tax=Thalassoroseus pseudoceratinae TaxID=2713176 RepID=UPI00141E077E|nr:sigma 54-interacting transcriptional regulator [Thalassoroseus pseudoceratinae]